MKRTFGFWIDPLPGLEPGHDSSLALMAEAFSRGHRVVCFESAGIVATGGTCLLRADEVSVDDRQRPSVMRSTSLPVSDVDVLFLRKDPPADMAYAHATRLLELSPGRRPLFVNDPRTLRDVNEKLFALRYPALSPETVITSSAVELDATRRAWGTVVLKPLDGCGGAGVSLLTADATDAHQRFAEVTDGGALPAVIQQYLPAAKLGDKRVIVWNGEPLGAILRVAKAGEFRCNFAMGGTAVRCEVDAQDRKICDALAPELEALGLLLVGVDVIGGRLTEVNVTSPTGLCEINRANGGRLEVRIIDDCERLRASA